MIERGSGVVAQTGVHRADLDDRAARRDEPVPALAHAELPERTGGRPASGHAHDRVEVATDAREVELGGGRGGDAVLVEGDAGGEEVAGDAAQDHAGRD